MEMGKTSTNLTVSIFLICCLLVSSSTGRSTYSRHRNRPHGQGGFMPGFGGSGFGGPSGFGGANPYGGGNGFNSGGFSVPNFSNSNAASQSASFNINTPFGGFSASNSAANSFGSNFQG